MKHKLEVCETTFFPPQALLFISVEMSRIPTVGFPVKEGATSVMLITGLRYEDLMSSMPWK